MNRPFPWERHYPPGARWDDPIGMSPLTDLLDRAVAAHGGKPAIEYRDREHTYATIGAMVDTKARALRDLGVGPGQTVALLLPNTAWHPVSFFASMRVGARVTHLSPLDPPRVLAKKMADVDATVLVACNLPPMLGAALDLLRAGDVKTLIVGDEASWGAGPAVPVAAEPGVVIWTIDGTETSGGDFPALSADDIALLQFTGGTTGFPKAAMLTHGNLTAAQSIYDLWAAASEAHVSEGDSVICVLPLFHIYALTVVLLRAIGAGAKVMLRPRFDVETTLRDIEVKRATFFPGVPTMWIALANYPDLEKRDFSSLRFLGSGGAPLPAEVRERFNRLTRLKLGGGWGMTETAPAGTQMESDVQYAPGAIGLPLPGIEMDVVDIDDPHRVLGVGEVGEIRIAGPNVFKGYWKRPEETAKAFADGKFLTGDMGYMDERGAFYIVDRKKDMILSGGFNVYPRVIEEAVYEHPDVAECVAIGIPDPYRGQSAKVFVMLRPGAAPFGIEALKAFLADRLGRHEIPVEMELRGSLPKTPVGKMSRKELVEEDAARRAAQAA